MGGACSITTTKVGKTLLICNWQSNSVLEMINYTQIHKIKPKKPQLLKFIQLKKIEISKKWSTWHFDLWNEGVTGLSN